jgi:hypothetical protein
MTKNAAGCLTWGLVITAALSLRSRYSSQGYACTIQLERTGESLILGWVLFTCWLSLCPCVFWRGLFVAIQSSPLPTFLHPFDKWLEDSILNCCENAHDGLLPTKQIYTLDPDGTNKMRKVWTSGGQEG